MAGSENFCLRLNGFEENAKIYWQELQTENDFHDVTLACDDKQIKTHKLVISSYSPVLRNILKFNQSPHPIIYLRRVTDRNLQNLLDFMYQGEANVAEEDLPSFLEVAEDLNIRGLSEKNTDGCNSKRKETLQFTNQNIKRSPKRKTTAKIEKEKIENINEYNSIGRITKFGKASDRFINNYNDNQTLFAPKEIINEVANRKCADDDKQNVISAVATIPDAVRSYSCGQCDFKTNVTFALNSHINSVHEGVCYPCGQCDYKAKYKQDLQRHVKSIHEGVCYPCGQCDCKAKYKQDLQKHVKAIHEGERYPCDQCDYKATQKINLRRHKLKMH